MLQNWTHEAQTQEGRKKGLLEPTNDWMSTRLEPANEWINAWMKGWKNGQAKNKETKGCKSQEMMDEVCDMLHVDGERARLMPNQHYDLFAIAPNTALKKNTLHWNCCQLHTAYVAWVSNLQQKIDIYAEEFRYHASIYAASCFTTRKNRSSS